MTEEPLREALTFDDVLLVPGYADFLPADASVTTRLTRELELRIPFVSAAMDTVTEWRSAVTMAREGGLGIIHKNLSPQAQAKEVLKVKRAESGMIVDPVTVHPDQSLEQAKDLMRQHEISGLPVVQDGKPVGILTSRDIRFEQNLRQPVHKLMTKELVTVPPGVDQQKARELLHKHRIEKLLVVGEDGALVGLITIKDLLQAEMFPSAIKDGMGRLRVGAAIGPGPDREFRTESLVQAGADVLVIDTAHGHTKGVIDAVRDTKKTGRAKAPRRSSRPASMRSRSGWVPVRFARPVSSRASASHRSPRFAMPRRWEPSTAFPSSPMAASSTPAMPSKRLRRARAP